MNTAPFGDHETPRVHRRYKQEEISLQPKHPNWSFKKKTRREFDRWMASGSKDFADFCQNVLDKFENLWMFTKLGDIDPTNNLAERDLRSLVLREKKVMEFAVKEVRGL